MPDYDVNTLSAEPVELREVTEQLLLAGLREHALSDQLQRQLAYSSAIAGSLAEGVCTLDRAGRISFINVAAEHLLGWSDAEVRGRDIAAILQTSDAASDLDAFPAVDVLRSGVTYRTSHALFLRKDGTTFPVAYSAAPMVVAEQVVGVVVAFDDLTEVQRLQHMQEEYLALMSHDLRTPLTAMIGYSQLLLGQLKEATLERAARSAQAIVKSGAAMERIIQNALDRSRQQADHAALQLARLDLVELVTYSIEQNMLPLDRARIEVETVASLPIIADAIRIERVVVNLLSNACKYSAPTSPVVVRIFTMGTDALISVSDQGIGVDADELPHLFEKHYRARTAGTIEGSGLGLYGSRLIVEAHGGRVWAQSTVGVGSTFIASIPLTEPSPSANEL